MTDIDIDAIRQREQAATPGPWDVFGASRDDDGRDALIVCHTAGDRTDPAPLAEIPFNVGDDLGDVHADAEFIAAARTDVPALLERLDLAAAAGDALRTSVDALTAELAEVREQLTAANRRADGAEADLRSAVKGNTAYANENARLRSQLAERDTEPAGSDHWVRFDASCWSDCPACKPITAEATR